jgi:hypothetical protein
MGQVKNMAERFVLLAFQAQVIDDTQTGNEAITNIFLDRLTIIVNTENENFKTKLIILAELRVITI